MMKKQLLMALGVSVMMQSANAASITSMITNGNVVDDYGTYTGYSEFAVIFNNLQSVQIDFDNGSAVQDDVSMSITNNTGTGWSGFDFTLVGVGFRSPNDVVLNTGTVSEFLFHENDPATGLPSGITLAFDPLEDVGLVAIGSVDTSFSSTYSLILTPVVVPVPAAVWLFGSGLIGLVGFARRKKS